ncbi:MAG: hydrogenase expression/formation protein HypE [Candidatus Omnitrophota bacterium]
MRNKKNKDADISRILLAYGDGGKLTHQLINNLFKKKFNNKILNELGDSAVIQLPLCKNSKLAFTTDSYVVNPLFFPGGDIGKLAICGTINDLAVTGAIPLYISCGFIIEEGLEYEILEKITESMAKIAKQENVKIVTGDVKVVEKNSADKLFINTSGIGIIKQNIKISNKKIVAGDKVIISGAIGEHGLAILNARGGFDFKSNVKSDCASLCSLIKKMLAVSKNIKFMRDPTRGGLATTLNEIVDVQSFGILVNEESVPIKKEIRAMCEILGFDPLYMANEGKVVAVVSKKDADVILKAMKRHPLGRNSQIIGEIINTPKRKVIVKTKIGGTRIIEMPASSQLPRIC